MTIKNMTVSALAATLLTTSAFAGTIGIQPWTVAEELNQGQDVNVTLGLASPTYTPTAITLGSLSDPVVNISFTGGTLNTTNDVALFAPNGDKICTYKAKTSSTLILEPVAGKALTNGLTYIFRQDDNTSLIAGDLDLQITKGSGSTTAMTLTAGSSATQVVADTASATTSTVVSEYSASVTTKANEKIDASNSFLTFYSPAVANVDTIVSTFTKTDVNQTAGNVATTQFTFSDTNSTATLTSAIGTTTLGGGIAATAMNDFNQTTTTTSGAVVTGNTITVTYTNDPTKALSETLFTQTLKGTYANGGYTETYYTAADAGTWAVYGYNGQIPNVSTSSAVETTLVFTNRSAINSEIIFTIIDASGNTATVDSISNGLTKMSKNTTNKYKMSDLLALTTGLTGDSFAVEVTIPTTPTSVYGYASFKNNTLGQFKDLPIYNNGNSY